MATKIIRAISHTVRLPRLHKTPVRRGKRGGVAEAATKPENLINTQNSRNRKSKVQFPSRRADIRNV